MHLKTLPVILPLVTLLILSGCDTDQRLSELAQRYAERQAEQSRQMAALQQELLADGRALSSQRDLLEQERRAWASFRLWDSLLATAIESLGLLVVCLLPLSIGWLLLRQASEPVSDQEVAALLLNDLAASEPQLWPRPLPLLPDSTPEPPDPPDSPTSYLSS